MSDKFIGYFRLVDACARSGCPVCSCVDEDSRRSVDSLLYEHVTDAETRHRLRDAWGFCNWHAAALLDSPSGATGAAILFADLLRVCTERVERLRTDTTGVSWLRFWGSRRPRLPVHYRSRARCSLCAALEASEESYLDAVVDFADDPEFSRAYERSTGLCLPHVVRIVDRRAAATGVESIMRTTLHKWQRLRGDLERFVRKHEYRNAESITESEAASWRLASEMLAGRRCLLNLAGERGANALAERALADLRAENERLTTDLAKARNEAASRKAG